MCKKKTYLKEIIEIIFFVDPSPSQDKTILSSDNFFQIFII